MMTKKVAFLFGLASSVALTACGEDDSGATSTGIGTFTTDTGDSAATESMTDDGGEAGTMTGSTGTTGADDGTGTDATSGGDGDSSGTTGSTGGDGDTGTTGTTGGTGGDGDSGTTGSTGGDGDTGTTGSTGSTGGDGDSGTSGGDGDTGTTGTTGGDGDSGTTGTTGGTSTTGGSGTTGSDDCQAPPTYVDCDGTPGVDMTSDPFNAVGLNCPGGNSSNSITATGTQMNSNNANAWRVISGYGSATGNNYGGLLWAANQDAWTSPGGEDIDPNTSSAVLLMTTGVIANSNANGVVTEASGSQDVFEDNGNQGFVDTLPAPLSAAYGSENGAGGNPFNNCDGVNDCSDSLYNHWFVENWNDPENAVWMSFSVDVPEGTYGYVFDFAYFSSEWPSWIDTSFNDLFIAWQVSEAYTGNVTFVNDAPLTITSLDDVGAFQYTNNSAQLAGTGFEGHAATGWFTARGAVNPNETAQITWFLADMGDSNLNTAVLLDNFRWECEGCIPSEIDDCGLTPLPE